jgi:membrane-associated phospholipid phosphatase
MNWESSLVHNLNSWGLNHQHFVKFISDDFVYIAIGLGLLTFLYDQIRYAAKPLLSPLNIRVAITDLILNIAFPVGISVAISQLISHLANRDRPFITDGALNFLKHASDSGMPALITVILVSLGFCVIGFHRNVGVIILGMALISGIGRMAAGIHYPTDLIVGIGLGLLVPYIYRKSLAKLKFARKR